MGKVWTLQDAKNKFSAVVEAAERGEPQFVTKRGAKAVVVLSEAEYERLHALDAGCRKDFVQHLLDAPKLPEGLDGIFDKREPMVLEMRDIDFGE
jgi:prevent-host-death family protein